MTDLERLNELAPDTWASFDLAHRILMGDYPMSDKLVALSRIDKAMGGTSEPINEAAVADYIATHTEA